MLNPVVWAPKQQRKSLKTSRESKNENSIKKYNMAGESLRDIKYKLERFYIPIKLLAGPQYKTFPILNSDVQTIIQSIENNLHKANTNKLLNRSIKVLDTNHILSYLYNYRYQNRCNDKLIYMAYIVFNGTLQHMIHSVVFHNRLSMVTEEYLCDVDSWKQLIVKLQKMQTLYGGNIRMDICIDYTRSKSVDVSLLRNGKQKEFFSQFDYKTLASMRVDHYLDNPASEISQWLQEWDFGAGESPEGLIHSPTSVG
jgi:hypothetical protein